MLEEEDCFHLYGEGGHFISLVQAVRRRCQGGHHNHAGESDAVPELDAKAARLMRIRLISSCTGEKSVSSPDQLTLKDFRRGDAHVRARAAALGDLLAPAEELYTGLQHQRLMRGVVAARRATVDEWAQTLGIPAAIRAELAEPCDLCIVLLGSDYLRACALDEQIRLGGPTVFLCGKHAAHRLPRIPNLHPVVLSNAEATTFSCGLVGLKGEVAARVLESLANNPEHLGAYLNDPQATVANPASPESGPNLRTRRAQHERQGR